MGSKTLEDLNRFKEEYQNQKQHLTLCQDQLAHRKIPKNCYSVNRFKKNPKALEYIDEKCQEIQFITLSYSEIKEGLKFPQLSSRCQNILKEKEEILNHVTLDKNPEKGIEEFIQN